jgi:hypothetical protein
MLFFNFTKPPSPLSTSPGPSTNPWRITLQWIQSAQPTCPNHPSLYLPRSQEFEGKFPPRSKMIRMDHKSSLSDRWKDQKGIIATMREFTRSNNRRWSQQRTIADLTRLAPRTRWMTKHKFAGDYNGHSWMMESVRLLLVNNLLSLQ